MVRRTARMTVYTTVGPSEQFHNPESLANAKETSGHEPWNTSFVDTCEEAFNFHCRKWDPQPRRCLLTQAPHGCVRAFGESAVGRVISRHSSNFLRRHRRAMMSLESIAPTPRLLAGILALTAALTALGVWGGQYFMQNDYVVYGVTVSGPSLRCSGMVTWFSLSNVRSRIWIC